MRRPEIKKVAVGIGRQASRDIKRADLWNDYIGFGSRRQEFVRSLRFLPWMIEWMETAFSELGKKGGRASFTLEEAAHNEFDFDMLRVGGL